MLVFHVLYACDRGLPGEGNSDIKPIKLIVLTCYLQSIIRGLLLSVFSCYGMGISSFAGGSELYVLFQDSIF